MKPRHLILTLLALLTSITASASISSQNFWTDSNGTTWCFETDGSNARLIPEEDPEDFYPCANGELSDLTIPSIVYVGQIAYTVSAIGARAFEDDSYTTSVIIPETVTSIGVLAFSGCTSLTTISIPSSVTSIGEGIFDGCSSLISVRLNIETPPSVENWFYKYSPPSRKATLYVPYGSKDAYEAAGYLTEFKEIIEMDPTPSSPIKFADANVMTICISNFDANGDGKFTFAEAAAVTTIGTVFMNNTSITSFDEFQYFTDVISIENNAFYGCSNLNSITLPENVTSIGENAFYKCSNLTSLTIPDGVTSIGLAAFYLCSSLASVNIPDGVTTIEPGVFGGCQVLESITIPNDVTSIGGDAFYDCRILTTITLPEGVTTIGQSAFYNCFALTTINIPDGVTSITDHTFYNCQSLSSVIIPDDVTSIGEYAFNYCKSLTSVTIPKNVTSIGEGAFRYCSDLTMVRVDVATPISINEECFSNRANATLYVPNGCKAAYEAADYWNEFKEIFTIKSVDDTFTAPVPCGDGTVALTFKITSLELEVEASGCPSGLTGALTIPASVQDEEGRTFAVTGIGAEAFREQAGLTSINIPDGVTSIGSNAFRDCSSLTSITIPEGVTSIEFDTFQGCSSLTSINIPKGITSIGHGAFYNCSNLTSITIPEGVTFIDHGAFSGCSSLTSINIPDGVTSIERYAFENCSSLTSINIPDGVTSIGGYAFDGCSSLTSITIPADVTSIGANAFRGCNSLNHVEFASLEDLHNIQFGNCSANPLYRGHNLYFGGALVTQVNIPSTWTSIPQHMLNGCTSMTQIVIPNGVANIGPYSLCETGLTSITIPKSVSSIDYYAFYGCSNLTNVIVENPSPVTITSDVFSNRANATLYVPAGSRDTYQTANYWKEFKEIFTIKSVDDTFTSSVPCGDGTVALTFKITSLEPLEVEVSGCPSGLTGALTIPASVQDDEGRTFAVTGIGAEAFKEQAGLTSVTLSEGITAIGANAFEGTALATVSLPSTLTAIGTEAFKMSDLESVVIPDGVTSIGASAFSDCGNLQSVTLGSGITSIGSGAFYRCDNLTSVTANMSTPVAITSNVFSNRANATLYVSLDSKEAYAAANNWKAFKNICGNIIFADANVKAICLANWDTDGNGELSSDEAAEVTSLGEVFKNNRSITAFNELQYFTGLTSIESRAFNGCSSLTSINIPESVTSIGNYAFDGCSSLTSITIPEGVTSIGNFAFGGCSSLTSITVESGNTKYDSRNGCNAIIETASNKLIAGCKNTTIPEGVTSIGDGAFYGSSLTSINIPKSVTAIGNFAFGGCSSLTSITIPEGVTSIGDRAFLGCHGLTSITIPESVTSIGNYAFDGCSSLTSITIPEGVTSIGYSAFMDCSGLTSITVESGNTKYDSRNGCNAIIETASNKLIAGCKNTTIPEGVTSIGRFAFSECSSLTSITIPEGVTSIGYAAFDDCSSLTSINIPDGVTSIEGYAFSGCSSLTSISIPESVTSIEGSAFSRCSSLTSINIPDGVTSIGESAFSRCSSLTSITVRSLTPPTLSSGAFNSISSDAVIYVPNKSLDAYKTSWSAYASMIQPFYTLTYQAVYNGEVVKSATVEAHPGDAIPAMPEELNCDFVTLTLEGTMPASVSDDHVLSYNVQWNGPFQFSTTEADATWYNLKVRLNKYMHVNETEPYFSNTDATPRELSQAEYQWAFGGNPYEVVLYNRSSDFSKSMTPANGFANHSPVVMRDGTYKWEIGQMNYELADGTNRPDFNLSVKDGSNTAFLNDFSQEDLALLVTSEYGDEGNRITTELAPSPNWISGEDVSCIAGNKVTIPLSLDNLDDIAGVQFELNVPAGMTLKKASVASRASAFSASFALASEGVYTLLIIQKALGETIATIDGHEGVFLNLELESDESMQLGDRTITYSDIVLTKADGNTVNTVDNTSTVTIVEPEPGDANRDGKVNVADIVAVANYILHSTPSKFSFDAANVNGDSTVNVADVVGIANIIINANQGNQVKALTGTEQELDPQ